MSIRQGIGEHNPERFIELGLTIAFLRKKRGLSSGEVGGKSKNKQVSLSAIEAPNIVRSFFVEILYNIAGALNVKPGDLLNALFPTENNHIEDESQDVQRRPGFHVLRFS